jgi:epoxyqueuosine reductase
MRRQVFIRLIYKDCKSVVVFAKCLPKGLAYVNPRIVYIKAMDVILNELDRISFLAGIILSCVL